MLYYQIFVHVIEFLFKKSYKIICNIRNLRIYLHCSKDIHTKLNTFKIMKKITQKQIVVDNGIRRLLVREFSTTYYTINNALNGKSLTPKHLMIREKAIELGGIEID